MMKSAFTIAAKDMRERIRDRSAFILGIIAPLGLAAIFSFVFNPIQDFEFDATYAVADQDGGPIAAVFVNEVLGGMERAGIIEVVAVDSVDAATALVEAASDPFGSEESADAAFVIPTGFSEVVQSDRPAAMEVIVNEGGGTEASVAVSVADGFASQLDATRLAVATTEHLGASGDRADAGTRFLSLPEAVGITNVTTTVKQLSGNTFYAAGLAIFFLFFTVQFGVNGLLDERNTGTLSRLLAAPIKRTSIILGKAITAFVLGVVSMSILVVATTLLFGADWGNPIGVLLLIVTGTMAAMGIMAIVAGFAKTAEQAGNFAGIIGMVLGFLGGTFFPIAQAGGVLAQMRFLTPHGWFMQGLGDLAGGNLADIVPAVVALLAFALATGSIALIRLRKGLAP